MIAATKNRDCTITIQCRMCGTAYALIYNGEDMLDWLSGKKFIQDSMEYLSASERELLISKTCGSCFDKMFPPLDLDIYE